MRWAVAGRRQTTCIAAGLAAALASAVLGAASPPVAVQRTGVFEPGFTQTEGPIQTVPVSALVADVVAGRRGRVWFLGATRGGGRWDVVGRATPAGRVEVAVVAPAGERIAGLLPAAGGGAWLALEGSRPGLQRVRLSGERLRLQVLRLPPGSRPSELRAGSDGTIWFLDARGPAVGYATSGGTVVEIGLPAGSQPTDPVVDRTGGLWFALNGLRPALGHVTRAGRLALYRKGIPVAARPGQLTLATDGAVWFANAGAHPGVGHVTPRGRITEFPTGSRPSALAPAPGGAVWVASQGSIGHIAISGSERFVRLQSGWNSTPGVTLPGAQAPPPDVTDLTIGPDGALWFFATSTYQPPCPPEMECLVPLSTQGAIGRLAADGGVRLFPVRAAGVAWPEGLVRGPDGALWFADASAGILGEVNACGAVTLTSSRWPLAADQPGDLTQASDGSLWFALGWNHPRLARLGLPRTDRALFVPAGPARTPAGGAPLTLAAPPALRANRLMVPLRALVAALGGRLRWDARGAQARVTLGSHRLTAAAGRLSIDGRPSALAAPAPYLASDGVLMVALRAVAQGLGRRVLWDGVGREATMLPPSACAPRGAAVHAGDILHRRQVRHAVLRQSLAGPTVR